jgi:hypothetical protein
VRVTRRVPQNGGGSVVIAVPALNPVPIVIVSITVAEPREQATVALARLAPRGMPVPFENIKQFVEHQGTFLCGAPGNKKPRPHPNGCDQGLAGERLISHLRPERANHVTD